MIRVTSGINTITLIIKNIMQSALFPKIIQKILYIKTGIANISSLKSLNKLYMSNPKPKAIIEIKNKMVVSSIKA